MNITTQVSTSLFPPQRPFGSLKFSTLVKLWELSGWLVARYYARLLQQHGRSPQALAERATDKDLEFYQHLFHGVDLPSRTSVLDIGCGMGDLIDFLQLQQVDFDGYLGIDLVAPFIEICQNEYLPPCRFQQANFVAKSFMPNERFELVVNMGVLVSRVVSYENYVAYSIDKMLAFSSKHVLFNVITEVDRSLGNYQQADRIGQITYLPRLRLEQILRRVACHTPVEYRIHEVRIYPDATDAFVHIMRADC